MTTRPPRTGRPFCLVETGAGAPVQATERSRVDERDACGLVAVARKDGAADERVLAEVIAGLCSLAHRSGRVDGEGDGAGVLTDIPRRLWSERLRSRGLESAHAYVDRFAVA